MNLKNYIETHLGTSANFARMMGVAPQTVVKWKAIGYCVFDGYMWKRMRPIKEPCSLNSLEASDAVQAALTMLYLAHDRGVMTGESVKVTANKIYEIMNGVEVKTLNDYLIEGGVESEQRVKSEEQGQEESSRIQHHPC